MVENKKDLFIWLKNHGREIRDLGVSKLGIFGSFVKGNPNEQSDVDVLVEFESGEKNFDNFINLAFFLEDNFRRPVEIVTQKSLSPYLASHILKEVEYADLS